MSKTSACLLIGPPGATYTVGLELIAPRQACLQSSRGTLVAAYDGLMSAMARIATLGTMVARCELTQEASVSVAPDALDHLEHLLVLDSDDPAAVSPLPRRCCRHMSRRNRRCSGLSS